MKRKILILLLVISMVGITGVPQSTHAISTINKINQELESLKKIKDAAQKKANETLNQMTKVQSQMKVTTNEMNALLDQIDQANQRLSQINQQIDALTDELMQDSQDLESAIIRIERRDQLLKNRIRLMYMNGIVSYLDVLLAATSFSDFLNRLDALRLIMEQDQEILESNKRDRILIEEKKNTTEFKLAEVKELHEEANDVREQLVVQEKEKEAKLSALSAQEKLLEGITEEQEKQLMKYATQEANLLKQKKELYDKLVYTFNGTKLGYPLAIKGRLTSNFGRRVDPITGKQGAMHSGMDFAAPSGTGILAAENGIVVVASWWGGYGNCVVIDHGKNTWTLYAHIRSDGLLVKKGDIVKRGQKIALVGSTGRSTGNHLHFEVRVNEVARDPAPYLR